MEPRGLVGRSAAVAVALVGLTIATAAGASAARGSLDPVLAPLRPNIEPAPASLTYQGQLTDSAGAPQSGQFDLVFQLWDDPAAGGQLGADIVRNGVSVTGGVFTVELPVPVDVWDARAVWLRIGVDGQWLTPRQALTPAPYALTLRPGARINGDGAEPFRTLTVSNAGLGAALRAEGASVGLHALGMTAVKGEGDVGVLGMGMVGVRGITDNEVGVEGLASEGIGVQGRATVLGGRGVVGSGDGVGGTGVAGDAMFGIGVAGSGEIGVKATGSTGFGLQASGPIGVMAEGTVADGVAAETNGSDPAAAVRGTAHGDAFGGHFLAENGVGVHGESSVNAGVAGHSVNAIGVVGTSTTGVGVSAVAGTVPLVAHIGTYGILASGQDVGVNAWGGYEGGQFLGPVGLHATGDGTSGEGVHGHGSGALAEGVLGTSDQATGVYGIAAGTSANAIGVWGQTSGTFGLYTAQKVYAGAGCVGCTVVLLAHNGSAATLQPGDVVAVDGIAPPLRGQTTPRLRVAPAAGPAGAGVMLGVVQGRAVAHERQIQVTGEPNQTLSVDLPAAADGAVAPGDDLFLVLSGLAQVNVDAGLGAVAVGDALAPSATDGRAGRAPDGDEVVVPVGHALESLARGYGKVWVLVGAR